MMNPKSRIPILDVACAVTAFAIASQASAHFLWLKTIAVPDGKPQAFLHFGESATDETYHFPEKLESVKIWRRGADGKREELKAEGIDSDDRVGRVAPMSSDEACVLEAAGQYGVYGTMLLDYCAKHVYAPSNDKLAAGGASKALKLDIIPASKDAEMQLTVLWDGIPLADAELLIKVGDDDIVEAKTDKSGQVTLRPKGEGLIGVLVNHEEARIKGELGGKEYTSRTFYSTLTFSWKAPGKVESNRTSAADRRTVPALPEPLSSFGAVVVDGCLYIYGGHTGTEHHHSAANLSRHFRRIRLANTGEASGIQRWEDLPMQTPLQGLPLVAHDGKIYRVGGLNARNATTDDETDLHSTAEFAEFDPSTGKWTTLAPLPAPRSSHNAAVVDGKLYVVGGWELAGKSPGTWQPATLVYDFVTPQAGWQEVKELPHKRRALAAAAWDGKLVVLGGMNDKGKISKRVELFDPATDKWSEGTKLPGAGMRTGFGIAACNHDCRLYASGLRGVLYRLNEPGSEWEEVARLKTPRFFHQLVPAAGGGLLAIGGAAQDGHLADIEWIDVDTEPTAKPPRSTLESTDSAKRR